MKLFSKRIGQLRTRNRRATPRAARAINRAIWDRLEDRVMLSYSPSIVGNVGTLTSDGSASTVRVDATVAGLLEWNDGSGWHVYWDGANTMTLPATATSTVVINELGANQKVVIGTPASPASALGATFQVNASSNPGDTVVIDDSSSLIQADAISHPYVIDTNNASSNYSIIGPNFTFQEPTGDSLGGITLKGSKADDTYNVLSVHYDSSDNAPEPVSIIAGLGSNTVNVGDPANSGGPLSAINSALNVSDPAGNTVLNVNDQGDTTSTSATITNNSVTGLSQGAINYTSSATAGKGVTQLNVYGGPGPGTGVDYTVQSTSVNTPVNLVTSGTLDKVTISNGGSVAGILGAVNVDNGGTGQIDLKVDASADSTSNTSTLSANGPESTLHGLAPADITYSTPAVDNLNILNSTGTNAFTVDFTNGNPIPTASGFNYDGGSGAGSSLMLQGGTFKNEVHNATGPGTGTIALTDNSSVTTHLYYSGLTPIGDSTTTTNYLFTDSALPDPSAAIQNGTGTGSSLIAGSLEFAATGSGFETTDVTNKTNVKFQFGSGADGIVSINVPTASTGLTSLIVNAGAGSDDLQLMALPGGVATSIATLGGPDTAEVIGAGLPSGTTNIDGGPGIDTLTFDAGGQPISFVTGPAFKETKITQGGATLDAKNFESINFVNVPAPAITLSRPATLNGTEGGTLSNVIVASFTVPTNGYNAGNFLSGIDWGDGTTTGAVVTQDPVNLNTFYIHGTHAYSEEGVYSPIVNVSFTGGTFTQYNNGVNMTATVAAGSPASVTDTATIADAPLLGQATPVVALEGNDTGSIQVANFTDSGGAETLSNYTAQVNFGDGSGWQAATISVAGTNFQVTANHTYAEDGVFATSVQIMDDGGALVSNSAQVITSVPNSTLTVGSVAIVNEATVTVSPASIKAVEGQPYSDTVATISDGNLLATPGEFHVKINWGDGTTSDGAVTATGPGQFNITGVTPHVYAEEGSYPVCVTVNDDCKQCQIVKTTAIVCDPSVKAWAGNKICVTEGANTGVVTLATFCDPGGPEVISDYSASIKWGDGSTTAGVLSYNPITKMFSVKGTHAYSQEGTFKICVAISHELSDPTYVNLCACVADAPIVGFGKSLQVKTNVAFSNLVIGSFLDTNPLNTTGNGYYTGSINWGDGSPKSTSSFVYNTTTHRFDIVGSHRYLKAGLYTVTLCVTDSPLSATIFTSTIKVC